MGNIMKKDQGTVQQYPQQQQNPQQQQSGGFMARLKQTFSGKPAQPPYGQQPQYGQQQQYGPRPPMQQQPQYGQQQQYGPRPPMQQYPQRPPMQQQSQYPQQQPQYPQQSGQYRPPMYPQQQQQPQQSSFQSGSGMPRYPGPSQFSLPNDSNPSSYFENNAFLSNLTGWSPQDIERLRQEFLGYTNSYGVIDRDGFRKLYIASLLNMTWDGVERDSEAAFRNFDINQTGVLDFNEYITACSRMTRDLYQSSSPMNPSFGY